MESPSRKKAFSDFFFGVAGMLIMNGVVQLLIYPQLDSIFGSERFGDILVYLCIVATLSASFGMSANHLRVLGEKNSAQSGANFNLLLIVSGIITTAAAFFAVVFLEDKFNLTLFIGYSLLFILTAFRYYSDAHYKISLDFKRYFIFYFVIALGYILGLFWLKGRGNNNWSLVFIPGELFAVLLVVFTGKIFRRPLLKSNADFGRSAKSFFILSGSYFIQNLILNVDRFLIGIFVDSLQVTVFYASTLAGKIIALLSVPLNGMIIGYLTKYEIKINRKKFFAFGTVFFIFGMLLCAGTVLFSRILIKVMYPAVFDEAAALFFAGNLGQILFFISNTLMVVILRYANEKYQMYLNIAYFVIYFALGTPALIFGSVENFANMVVIINLIRFLVILISGTVLIGKANELERSGFSLK